jgi:DNA topoisomerase III
VVTAVVAEKPSVARDLASVLGAKSRRDGAFEGNGWIVTWCIGHLVALAQPHEIEPAWKRWSLSTLPMLPERFPLVVLPETRAQFGNVRRILRDREVEQVVCATDAGREGELIFRYVYEAAECRKPVKRLWISSLTPQAIRDGFRRLEDGARYDRLADAAKGRSRADWLVGMNLSRAYSLALDQELSIGRVQTPTLAMLVDRELAIRAFVPEDYLEVIATFTPKGRPRDSGAYEGTWFRPKGAGETSEEDDAARRRRLPPDGAEAAAIIARTHTGRPTIESVESAQKRLPPPLLYDLTELQRHANRLYGLSAKKTLDVAQSLYEQHKLISYPRTDSRHLSKTVADGIGDVVRTIESRYAGLLAQGTGTRPLGRRYVDDAKVSDHHAIVPTGARIAEGRLSEIEAKIYDLICRRLLQAWHEDHVVAITNVITAIRTAREGGGESIVDRYASRGTAIERIGWKVLDVGAGKKKGRAPKGKGEDGGDREDDQELPPGLTRGLACEVLDAIAKEKRTRPPARFTEATLLTAMETAGKTLDEKELSDAMKDVGLGTPATRAQIIETLLRREYVVREGKSLQAT